MFGKNEIVGRSFFKDTDKLFVTTIFGPTIQGEGPYAGQPAIFIRLAKCNLNCSFCDTYFDDGDWMTINTLMAKVRDRVPEKYNRGITHNLGVVITGGEPTLQKIEPLVERLSNVFKWVQIESNGILQVDYPDNLTLVVSPKCSEKTNLYLKPHPMTLQRADCLKFVVSADPKSPYHDIPLWAHEWAALPHSGEIYISPMNMYNDEPLRKRKDAVKNLMTLEERSVVNEVVSFWDEDLLNRKENQANHEYAAEFALKYGYRTSIQMHLYMSLP